MAWRPSNGPAGTPTNSIRASPANRAADAVQPPDSTAGCNAARWSVTRSATALAAERALAPGPRVLAVHLRVVVRGVVVHVLLVALALERLAELVLGRISG